MYDALFKTGLRLSKTRNFDSKTKILNITDSLYLKHQSTIFLKLNIEVKKYNLTNLKEVDRKSFTFMLKIKKVML